MRRFIISELSMSPVLRPGDRVLTRRARSVRRGDVIFFAHPDQADFWLVKRVVGLEDESMEIEGGEVRIDGSPYADPWTVDPTYPGGNWEVPAGHVFVLSDARTRTGADSRRFGPVPVAGAYRLWFRYRGGGP